MSIKTYKIILIYCKYRYYNSTFVNSSYLMHFIWFLSILPQQFGISHLTLNSSAKCFYLLALGTSSTYKICLINIILKYNNNFYLYINNWHASFFKDSHKVVQHWYNNFEIVDFPIRKEYIIEIIESPDAIYLQK